MLKVFIADDSITYRTQIEKRLALSPKVEVIGSSRIGTGTAKIIGNNKPDLLILDLESAESSGFALLEVLHMDEAMSFPLLGLIGQEKLRSKAQLLGCIDLIGKTAGNRDEQMQDSIRVAESVLGFALNLLDKTAPRPKAAEPRSRSGFAAFEPSAIVIASSTGGPPVLDQIFKRVKDAITIPVLITQHMPESFTKDLSRRLAQVSHNTVREAIDGEEILPGLVYVAPGNFHMRLTGNSHRAKIVIDQGDRLHSVRPAADYLFKSAAAIYGAKLMGFILTGMGNDGAEGARCIKQLGGMVMLQDKESSAVWGMPGAAHALGAFDGIGSIDTITELFIKMTTRKMP